jgi:hypothetical protein
LVHLGGPTDPSQSGAFHRLEAEDWNSALRKIEQALVAIAAAAVADPSLDLRLVQMVLAQVAESVAADLYGRARAALDPPSRGQARQLRDIGVLFDRGRADRAADRWLEAVASFREVTRRSTDLLKL